MLVESTMETTEKTPQEILRAAAELLEQPDRWVQNAFFTLGGPLGWRCCAHGAITYCGGNSVFKNSIENEAKWTTNIVMNQLQAAARVLANRVGLSYEYNDAPTTTVIDVIDKLREAAQLT